MLRSSVSLVLVVACAASSFGQTLGTNPFGQTTGGFGQTTGVQGTTASPFGQTGGAATGQSPFGGAFGSTVSLDPSFGATQISSGLATAAAVSRATSALTGRSGFGGGFGGFGGGFGGRGGFGGFGGQQNNSQQPKVRAVLRVGFPVEARDGVAVAEKVNERFTRMPLPKNLSNIQIAMDGRTAVLRGQVEAEEDVKLMERLLSLEPGIDAVRSEVTIAGQASANQSSTPRSAEPIVIPSP